MAPPKKKKRGPPRTTGPGEQVVVRLHDPLLSAIDNWRSSQNGELTRADALRRIAALYFGFPVEVADQKVLAAGASKRRPRK
jgi:hypothetical protein